jgi:hypothetical protein
MRISVETLADRLVQGWPTFSEAKRRQFEALLRVNRRDIHGSTSGWVQHWELGEPACPRCRLAHAEAQREFRSQRRQRQQAGGA